MTATNHKESQTDDKLTRRRKRAERNKMRTIKHIHKLLDSFQEILLKGFSNDGWSELASNYRQLSPFLAPEEYTALGHLWRSTWTQEISSKTMDELIIAVKNRIASSNY